MKTTASACLIAALVIFTSCHERNFFCDDAKLVEKFPKEVSLTATPFMENVYGYDGMISTGNKIVLLSNKLSHIFYVYDMNGVLSGEFGTIGRGPGEMLGCRETGQGLLFNDVNNRRLVSVDLEASLARGALVQNASYETLPMSSNCYLGRDSVLFIEQMTDSNFHMISYDMKTGERRSETLYSEDVDNPYAYYQSTWRKHPERDILVGGMWWLNQINIISMEDGSRKSLMIGKRPPVYNDAVSTGGLPVHSYYIDIIVTAERIYALCMDQSYDLSYKQPKPMEIHEFDWEGRPLRKLHVQEYITRIAIDNTGKHLYGMNDIEESICRYVIQE